MPNIKNLTVYCWTWLPNTMHLPPPPPITSLLYWLYHANFLPLQYTITKEVWSKKLSAFLPVRMYFNKFTDFNKMNSASSHIPIVIAYICMNTVSQCIDTKNMSYTTTWHSPVVWKASSTIPSSLSDAARWKTEKMFFHPDLMLAALEWTICATHRTTMSRIVSDLEHNARITVTHMHTYSNITRE